MTLLFETDFASSAHISALVLFLCYAHTAAAAVLRINCLVLWVVNGMWDVLMMM